MPPEPSGAMTTCSGCCPFAAQAEIKAVMKIKRPRIEISVNVRGVPNILRSILFFFNRFAPAGFRQHYCFLLIINEVVFNAKLIADDFNHRCGKLFASHSTVTGVNPDIQEGSIRPEIRNLACQTPAAP